jgi:DNA-binding transcriptional ArsR family regulator
MIKKWTFLSNHLRVLAYLTDHPETTNQSLAYKVGLSIRAIQIILDDLEKGGYLTRERIGRNNRYEVNPEKPLRHRLDKHHSIGDILHALGKDAGKAESARSMQSKKLQIFNMQTGNVTRKVQGKYCLTA